MDLALIEYDDTADIEEAGTISATAAAIDRITLDGLRSPHDESDTPPDEEMLAGILTHAMNAYAGAVEGTALERDLDELLWSLVNVMHRRLDVLQHRLDENEDAQRILAAEQDGSEVKSVELERKLAEGEALLVRRDTFEAMRDAAAAEHTMLTGSPWMPRSGSRISHARLTSAVVDSRDWRAAKRRRETDALCPAGTRIAFAGGTDFTDHGAVLTALDRIRHKHPDMVLMHGGSLRGAELIAAKWADAKGVPQVIFRPDWTRHGKAAPFKRNDALLTELPIGLIAFPGSGITGNLVDKARKMGIPVLRPIKA